MTIEEAIADIRDNIKPVVGGISLDMAIKSLETLDKVKEEIEDKIDSLDDELKNGEVCLSYYYGKLAGLSEVLEIIDKHLAEVRE